MRRIVPVILTLLAIIFSGCITSQVALADIKALEAAAIKEGSLTWYVSHHTAEDAETMGRAFTAKHPGIKVNVVRSTAAVAYQRLLQDLRSNTAQADVYSTTDITQYVTLKKQGALASYDAVNSAQLAAEYKGSIDPDRTHYPTSAGVVYIAYNKNKVSPENAPKNWKDLLDPKWQGQLGTGHPGFSGYVAIWGVLMKKLYGPDFFKKLADNRPLVGRSIYDTITQLNSGERNVAVAAAENAWSSADKGNPIGVVYPTDGTFLAVEPTAILKNAPHPNAARLFLEFALSQEYAQMIANFWRIPVRSDVKLKAGLRPLSETKIVPISQDELVEETPKVIENWRNTFGS